MPPERTSSITLVATDLDGTFWDRSLVCHPRTLEAVRTLQARPDVELIAATGRRRNSARRGLDANGVSMPAVLLNGAVGYDFVDDDLFHMVSFDNPVLREILTMLEGHGVAPVAYLADTTAVAVEGVTTSPHHLSTLEADLVWWSFEKLAERSDVLGLSMLGIEREVVDEAFAALRDFRDAEVAGFGDELYAPFSLMIAPPDVTKQRGIEAYCRARGLAPTRIVAMGDAGNDVPMLEGADVSVVVAGAADDVRALADHEIRPPAEGGWADVLDLL